MKKKLSTAIAAVGLGICWNSMLQADEKCTNSYQFDFKKPEYALQLFNIAKWEVDNSVDCTLIPGIKSQIANSVNQMKSAVIQYGLQAIASMLPFPLPIGSLLGGGGSDGSTAAILSAIANLQKIVEQQNINLVGYSWYKDVYSAQSKYKGWQEDKFLDNPIIYQSDAYGYSRLAVLADDIRAKIDDFSLSSSNGVHIEPNDFFHIFADLVQLQINLKNEYQTFAYLSKAGAKNNTSAKQILVNQINSSGVGNTDMEKEVRKYTIQNSAYIYGKAIDTMEKTVIPAVKRKAESSVTNISTFNYPDTASGSGYMGYGAYYYVLNVQVGDNYYRYNMHCSSTGAQTCTWSEITVNGKYQVERPYAKKYNTQGQLAALRDFIIARSTDSYYTHAYGNLVKLIHTWEVGFSQAWNEMDYLQRQFFTSKNTFITKSSLINVSNASGNTAPVYNLTLAPTVYYQPLASDSIMSTPLDEARNAFFNINVSGLSDYITYAEVTVNISHDSPADLLLTMRKPNGQVVTLRDHKTACEDQPDAYDCATLKNTSKTYIIPLSSSENINGLYSLIVNDTVINGLKPVVLDWQIIFK